MEHESETTADANSAPAVHYLEFSSSSYSPQLASPLFTVLPPEIRDLIFAYALADYEDTSALYAQDTCYKRPNYSAPRRCDTALLRTCQQIYREAWFLPWTSSEKIFYFTADDRRPDHVMTLEKIQPTLDLLHTIHAPETIELNHVRIFPQLYMLENGLNLTQMFNLRHFHPRSMTVTLRHTDWWFWESDEPLRICAEWVRSCRFPESVREFRMELESLQRKKDQIDDMAVQIAEGWKLQRSDGVLLAVDETELPLTTQWSGSSIWGEKRWIRDEVSTPGRLEYYVRTVIWRPFKPSPDTDLTAAVPYAEDLRTRVHSRVPQVEGAIRPFLPTRELNDAGILADIPAAEALRMLDMWKQWQHEQRREARRQRMLNRRPTQGPQPPSPRSLRYMARAETRIHPTAIVGNRNSIDDYAH